MDLRRADAHAAEQLPQHSDGRCAADTRARRGGGWAARLSTDDRAPEAGQAGASAAEREQRDLVEREREHLVAAGSGLASPWAPVEAGCSGHGKLPRRCRGVREGGGVALWVVSIGEAGRAHQRRHEALAGGEQQLKLHGRRRRQPRLRLAVLFLDRRALRHKEEASERELRSRRDAATGGEGGGESGGAGSKAHHTDGKGDEVAVEEGAGADRRQQDEVTERGQRAEHEAHLGSDRRDAFGVSLR